MIPLIRNIAHALLWDEMAVRRWLRGGMLGLAAGGVAFADQIADTIGAPHAVKAVKVAAIVAGFISGAISVGERNPR